MALVQQIHGTLSNTVLMFLFICGVWAVFTAFRGGMNSSLAGALVLAEGLLVFQVLLGLLDLVMGGRTVRMGLHILYGITIVLTLPALYTYTKDRSATQQSLWFGGGALFIVGLALRGITTGRGG